jgi:hypothetical protein
MLDVKQARRLALARAGLLKPQWTGLPRRATAGGNRARRAAHRVIRRFGYLQLDTVAVAGARSHAIVLMSRLEGFDPALAEDLLKPDAPLFEYWGHEACWMPIHLYPVFAFRRRDYRRHPWWGDLIGAHPGLVRNLLRRISEEGPLRSVDMEGRGGRGWWDLKQAKRVAAALWSAGRLAIRQRTNFQRVYDLTERVIPPHWRSNDVSKADALEHLLMRALRGHGWAATGTLAQTWRFRNARRDLDAALDRLSARKAILPCALQGAVGRKISGWIRPSDLSLAARLTRVRPRQDRGVLLSPFDPVLWDRRRVGLLFGFDQVLEIFKPAARRVYGYYCLPVLAGEYLVARVDLKADRKRGKLHVLSTQFEAERSKSRIPAVDREAVRTAVIRYAEALALEVSGLRA